MKKLLSMLSIISITATAAIPVVSCTTSSSNSSTTADSESYASLLAKLSQSKEDQKSITDQLAGLQQQAQVNQKTIASLQKQINYETAVHNQNEKDIQDLKDRMNLFQSQLQKLREAISSAQDKINLLNQQISFISKQLSAVADIYANPVILDKVSTTDYQNFTISLTSFPTVSGIQNLIDHPDEYLKINIFANNSISQDYIDQKMKDGITIDKVQANIFPDSNFVQSITVTTKAPLIHLWDYQLSDGYSISFSMIKNTYKNEIKQAPKWNDLKDCPVSISNVYLSSQGSDYEAKYNTTTFAIEGTALLSTLDFTNGYWSLTDESGQEIKNISLQPVPVSVQDSRILLSTGVNQKLDSSQNYFIKWNPFISKFKTPKTPIVWEINSKIKTKKFNNLNRTVLDDSDQSQEPVNPNQQYGIDSGILKSNSQLFNVTSKISAKISSGTTIPWLKNDATNNPFIVKEGESIEWKDPNTNITYKYDAGDIVPDEAAKVLEINNWVEKFKDDGITPVPNGSASIIREKGFDIFDESKAKIGDEWNPNYKAPEYLSDASQNTDNDIKIQDLKLNKDGRPIIDQNADSGFSSSASRKLISAKLSNSEITNLKEGQHLVSYSDDGKIVKNYFSINILGGVDKSSGEKDFPEIYDAWYSKGYIFIQMSDSIPKPEESKGIFYWWLNYDMGKDLTNDFGIGQSTTNMISFNNPEEYNRYIAPKNNSLIDLPTEAYLVDRNSNDNYDQIRITLSTPLVEQISHDDLILVSNSLIWDGDGVSDNDGAPNDSPYLIGIDDPNDVQGNYAGSSTITFQLNRGRTYNQWAYSNNNPKSEKRKFTMMIPGFKNCPLINITFQE